MVYLQQLQIKKLKLLQNVVEKESKRKGSRNECEKLQLRIT